jgi:hypothetical protein
LLSRLSSISLNLPPQATRNVYCWQECTLRTGGQECRQALICSARIYIISGAGGQDVTEGGWLRRKEKKRCKKKFIDLLFRGRLLGFRRRAQGKIQALEK